MAHSFLRFKGREILFKGAAGYGHCNPYKVTQRHLISENMRCIWNYRTNWKSLKVRWIFFFI